MSDGYGYLRCNCSSCAERRRMDLVTAQGGQKQSQALRKDLVYDTLVTRSAVLANAMREIVGIIDGCRGGVSLPITHQIREVAVRALVDAKEPGSPS